MKRLPIDKEGRLKEIMIQCKLTESMSSMNSNLPYNFSKEDIELIANEKRICYICEGPVFDRTYTVDGNINVKRYAVNTMMFGENFFKIIQEKYSNGEIYVFFSLSNGMIRGCFVEDFDDIISKERDDRIIEVLK